MRNKWLFYVKETSIFFVLGISSLFFCFPLLWTFLTSIKPGRISFSIPPVWIFRPTLHAYRELFAGIEIGRWPNLPRMALNSFTVAGVTTILALFLAVLASYAISRFLFRGKRFFSFFLISIQMLPPIALIVPMFLVSLRFGLRDTHLILIISYAALTAPFATWMLRGFFYDVPKELEDAAAIDGCTRLQALWMVVLPLVKPGLAATSIFTFLMSWNEFALALVLTTPSGAGTLPTAMTGFITDEGFYWPEMTATTVILIVPAIIFVIFAQGAIAKGLTLGAVKG